MAGSDGVNVLLVDDKPENLLALEAVLEPLALNLVRATSGEEALQRLDKHDYAVVLLDVQMPGLDGFETAKRMRAHDKSRHTPIIFITAVGVRETHVSRGYSLGAVDYLIKPFEPESLRAKVAALVAVFQRTRSIQQKIDTLVEPQDKVNILIVDDEPANLLAVETLLASLGENVLKAESGRQALRLLLRNEVGVVLLDVHMPGMDGFETAELIKTNDRTRHVPIIFVTAIHKAQEDVARGYALGAPDYLFTPLNPDVLLGKVSALVGLCRNSRTLQRQLELIQSLNAKISASQAALLEVNQTLERRVEERTAQLQAKSEEVASMTQQLWQAAKLATMGELTASIAHELNNPLQTVTLHLESLLEGTPEGTEARHSLNIMEQEVERMANLIANLLQFSRRAPQEISTVDLRDEVNGTLELIHYHLRKRNVKVDREYDPGTPAIQADRQQLRQLLLNLFTNASDAMPRGGMLKIRAGVWECGGVGEVSTPKHPDTHTPTQVTIEVSDTGVGIAPDDLPKVMEPFFTTKEEGQGTGLGLAICRRIVQEHSGTLDIVSEVGKGTTVCIRLPVGNRRNAEALAMVE